MIDQIRGIDSPGSAVRADRYLGQRSGNLIQSAIGVRRTDEIISLLRAVDARDLAICADRNLSQLAGNQIPVLCLRVPLIDVAVGRHGPYVGSGADCDL